MRTLLVIALVAGCGSDTYLIVTVNARPSVHDATKLEITQQNGGTMRIDTLPLDGHAFPVTFSISAPGRSGQLDLSLKALSMDGLLVGLGSGSTPLSASDYSLQLDPADFVVNTDFADDQFLTTDFETLGFQLAATTDGNWTTAFRSTCSDTCNIFARRFDSDANPVKTNAAAGTNAFPINTMTTQQGSFPAIAGAGTTTLGIWDFLDTTGGGTGVACRAIDAAGTLSPGQISLTTDAADTASLTPLSNGNFAVAWQITTPSTLVRTIIAKPDCNPLQGAPITVSTVVASLNGPHRSDVANNGASVLYTWITDDAVHVRPANTAAVFSAAESTLISPPVGSLIEAARVVAMGTGFGVAIRLKATNGTSPGSILLYRVTAAGALMTGAPTLITDKSGSDFSTGNQGFGLAARADGAIMVVWHQCDDGSASVCDGRLDVYGRVVRPTGVPVGDPFMVPTSTVGNQVNPSVVGITNAFAAAWNDASKTPPDENGTAVRARVIYPAYDDATAVLGAPCNATLPPCGAGLACGTGTDMVDRCFETCSPPMCPNGGTCSPAGGASACTF